MQRIVLDAAGWQSSSDFYDALLPALGAPQWHGHNLDALLDSLTAGEINAVGPPFIVEIQGIGSLNDELRAFLERVADVFISARNDRDTDVKIILSR
ncbi:MAG TPA: barstar family protein [Kofleriaceae bacterium]|nr:barstar family protein [Kofleriaceae bacterium]